jgi:ubiquinone/menaquinone biosynthesis C-methylase UbiE
MKDNPYNLVAEWYEKSFGGKENRYLKRFVKLVPKQSRILDIGCGTGDDTKFLLRKGFKVTSIDSSKEMLSIAKKKIPNHKFLLKDMRKISYPAESFQGIVSAFSLQHTTKKEAAGLVKKLGVFLKKGGVFYLALQEGEGKKKRTVKWNPEKEITFWVNMYTFQEIKKLLESSSFTVVFKTEANPINKKAMQNKKLYVIARKVK